MTNKGVLLQNSCYQILEQNKTIVHQDFLWIIFTSIKRRVVSNTISCGLFVQFFIFYRPQSPFIELRIKNFYERLLHLSGAFLSCVRHNRRPSGHREIHFPNSASSYNLSRFRAHRSQHATHRPCLVIVVLHWNSFPECLDIFPIMVSLLWGLSTVSLFCHLRRHSAIISECDLTPHLQL